MGSNGWINGGGSMQIGVGLCLELGEGHGNQLSSSRSSNGFTFLQLQELEQQTLIYKCMEAGLPVPSHLIFPIWKSVVSSLSGLGGRIHPNHYNLVNYGPWWCCDNTYSIDPEPGRCRRTDGKKWRCSRDVVPGRKYCERHMHRGRQRSRKHVEASQLPNYVTSITRKLDSPKSDTGLTISLPSSSNASNVSPR